MCCDFLEALGMTFSCDQPNIANYGRFYPENVITDGSKVTMVCNSGTEILYGDGQMTCRNGTWIGDYPICVVKGR